MTQLILFQSNTIDEITGLDGNTNKFLSYISSCEISSCQEGDGCIKNTQLGPIPVPPACGSVWAFYDQIREALS